METLDNNFGSLLHEKSMTNGLKKQLDLLGVEDIESAIEKVKYMGKEERSAWLNLAKEISEIRG